MRWPRRGFVLESDVVVVQTPAVYEMVGLSVKVAVRYHWTAAHEIDLIAISLAVEVL